MAVFLSLGIGIMVGTSISESVIVDQQKVIIEELEVRYFDSLKEKEDLILENDKKELSLQVWDNTLAQIVNVYSYDKLKGKEVGVFSFDQARGEEVRDFLETVGININPYIHFKGDDAEKAISEETIKDIFTIGQLLMNTVSETATSFEFHESPLLYLDYSYPVKANTLLLIGGQTDLDKKKAQVVREYLENKEGIKVIILEDLFFEGSFLEPLLELDLSAIDYIDTTPGKIALLALLKGEKGSFTIK